MPFVHPISLAVAFALLAWACEIGMDPPLPPPPAPPPPAVATAVKATGRALQNGSSRFEQPKLATAFDARLDKARFLSAFKRQADVALMGCLRKWRTGASSLLVAADLTKEGKFINILFLGVQPPPCAAKAIAAMNFSTLTTNLAGSSLVVQWRVDW